MARFSSSRRTSPGLSASPWISSTYPGAGLGRRQAVDLLARVGLDQEPGGFLGEAILGLQGIHAGDGRIIFSRERYILEARPSP